VIVILSAARVIPSEARDLLFSFQLTHEQSMTNSREDLFRLTAFARCAG